MLYWIQGTIVGAHSVLISYSVQCLCCVRALAYISLTLEGIQLVLEKCKQNIRKGHLSASISRRLVLESSKLLHSITEWARRKFQKKKLIQQWTEKSAVLCKQKNGM